MSYEPSYGQVAQPLTSRQREILRVIQQVYAVLGEPPSVRYLGRRFAMTHHAVQEHLDALYRKGWLRLACPAGVRCLHYEG